MVPGNCSAEAALYKAAPRRQIMAYHESTFQKKVLSSKKNDLTIKTVPWGTNRWWVVECFCQRFFRCVNCNLHQGFFNTFWCWIHKAKKKSVCILRKPVKQAFTWEPLRRLIRFIPQARFFSIQTFVCVQETEMKVHTTSKIFLRTSIGLFILIYNILGMDISFICSNFISLWAQIYMSYYIVVLINFVWKL